MASSEPNHFERLGLPGRFSVDPAELERAYLARSREVHPDFGLGGLHASAALNEAYATLKDPFRRADYLLSLHDAPPAPPLTPAFLMQAMELRERLETAGGDAEQLAALDAELGTLIAAEHAAVARLFNQPKSPETFEAIRGRLNSWKTLASLRRGVQDAVTE